ncbi:MAG TPA: M48 family metallopeptidase [Methanobacterium sp.]|nr:M48 family metallopeptidase [Methanobacterium sp.]
MKQIKPLKIKDLEIDYQIIHRKVKYPRLEIKTNVLYVIVPEYYDDAYELIVKHESWIYKNLYRNKKHQKLSEGLKLNLELHEGELKNVVQLMVEEISGELDVSVGQVKFRRMKSRWGSCSSKGNLNFNYYLKFLPENLIEYIVYHEVSHLLEMGHNKRFWQIISQRYPNHKEIEEELSIYWLKVKDHVGIT